ncbi:MAG: hypothetical protein J7497_01910 [Chitinophagaceae bacterium]|nr:hypothetical protein [Chitinophagaceae bacterium]
MKNILQFVVATIAIVACQSKKPVDLSGCYRMIIKKDTAVMSLNSSGDSVSGSLSYHWFEKDHNDGTFKGIIKNDSLIVADYTFQSEGSTLVRQVVFKIKDSILQQGYGELIMKNDTSFLRDPVLAVFDTKNPFRKGCD